MESCSCGCGSSVMHKHGAAANVERKLENLTIHMGEMKFSKWETQFASKIQKKKLQKFQLVWPEWCCRPLPNVMLKSNESTAW